MDVLSMLGVFQNVKDALNSDTKQLGNIDLILAEGSMIKFLGDYVIEPLVVVDKDLKDEDYIYDLQKLNLNIYISFLTAVFRKMVEQDGMDVNFSLKVISTSDETVGKTAAKSAKDLISNLNRPFEGINLNSEDYDLENIKTEQFDNLVKTVEIKVNTTNKHGDKVTMTIPLIFRAKVIYTDVNELYDVIELKSDKTTELSFRYLAYKAGDIDFYQIFIPTDRAKKYKKIMTNRTNELLVRLRENEKKSSFKSALTSGLDTFVKTAAMLIMDRNKLSKFNTLVAGDLKKPKYMNKIMRPLGLSLTSIVDNDMELLDLYMLDSDNISREKLANLSKKEKSNDINELFKIMMANKAIF